MLDLPFLQIYKYTVLLTVGTMLYSRSLGLTNFVQLKLCALDQHLPV